MSKTIRDNKSNTHLIVDSLTVIKKIKGGGITQINDNIEALRQAQQTLSENTKDYWTSLTADNVINPEEKKILYKEWKIIETEYIALLDEATASGLIESSQAIIDYKNNYEALYSYVITTLKVFDNMTTTTKLNNRELFIKRYNDYYASRDKLRNAIKDGELTDLDNTFQGKVDNLQDQIKDISQGSVADGSITADKLSADMRDSIKQFEAASATGFLTDDILNAIDTSVTASSDALNLRIDEQGKSTKLYLQLYSDKINSIIDDAKRVTRSHLKQTSDSITLSVVNLAKETATQLKLTDEAITAMATNLRAETTAALKITSNRITEMVTGGSSEAYLSLSVGIPYFITPTKYSEWETKLDESGKEYLRNVYAKTNVGTDQEPVYYYVMQPEVAPAAINTLTTKLRALDKLSSQIVIDADMVQVKGETIFSAEGTLKEAFYDYGVVAPTTFITQLMEDGAWDGTSIIEGGFIKTDFINADAVLTKLLSADAILAGKITVGNQLLSENYEQNKQGYSFFKDGTVDIQDGNFRGKVIATDGEFTGVIKARNIVKWYEDGDLVLRSGSAEVQGYRGDKEQSITTTVFSSKGEGTVGVSIGGKLFYNLWNDRPFNVASLKIHIELILRGKEGYVTLYEKTVTDSAKGGEIYKQIDLGTNFYRKLEVTQDSFVSLKINMNVSGDTGPFRCEVENVTVYQKYVNDFLRN